jgi:hypothetical protein
LNPQILPLKNKTLLSISGVFNYGHKDSRLHPNYTQRAGRHTMVGQTIHGRMLGCRDVTRARRKSFILIISEMIRISAREKG